MTPKFDIAFVTQSSRWGDCLSQLPLVYHEAQKGKKVIFVGPKQLAPWLDGIGYCEFQAIPDNVEKPAVWAKWLAPEILTAPDPLPEPQTDSWAKEAWHLLGRLPLWKQNLPLVFDKWKPEIGKEKFIVIAPEGRSARFPYRDLLVKLMTLKFSDTEFVVWDALNHPDLKPETWHEILANAHCLITPDTMHLHLARAFPNLPVVALVNDKIIDGPFPRWLKSPWQPNHIFHCLYGDFPIRAVDVLDKIENAKLPIGDVTQMWSALDPIDPETKRLPNHLEITRGMFGRDSTAIKDAAGNKDGMECPFLKDAIRAWALGAKGKSLLVLTRGATNIENLDAVKASQPVYAHRVIRHSDAHEDYHPAFDLFAFTKEFWEQHGKTLPDLVLSNDTEWTITLAHWMQSKGAREIRNVCYRRAV